MTPRTRGAGGGGHRNVRLGADLALFFGSGRGSHHWRYVAAIAIGNNGGRRKMNPPIGVASDPVP